MADKKNLCAQIDIALHNRVTEEKDRLEMTTSQYIAALLTEYYKMKDENGGINMTGSRTMAFQIPEELFQRIKTHLARETARTGVKLTQRDFVLGLIEQALAEAEASLAPQEGPESTEEAPEDNGAAGTTPDASEASTEAERGTADIEQYWTSTTVQRKMQSSSASGQGCFRLSTHLQPAGVAGSALTPKEKNCAISMTTTQTCGNGCWSCRPCPTR